MGNGHSADDDRRETEGAGDSEEERHHSGAVRARQTQISRIQVRADEHHRQYVARGPETDHRTSTIANEHHQNQETINEENRCVLGVVTHFTYESLYIGHERET